MTTDAPRNRPAAASGTSRGGAFSIRIIVTVVALAITTGATIAVGTIAERNTRRALTGEVEARLLIEARNVARASAPALLSEYPELTLHPLARRIQAEQDDLALLVVTDHQGKIQGHPDPRHLGTPFVPPLGLREEATDQILEPNEKLLGNEEMLAASCPIRQAEGKALGQVMVGLRREYVEDLVSQARRETFLVVAGTLFFATAVTFMLMTGLLRPVDTLRAGLERIGRGDLDTPLDVRDRTELGMLAQTVNAMKSELREAQAMMVEKERLAHELELARQIQHSLLPPAPIRTGSFLVEGNQIPAAEVGGDYFDYFPLKGGRIGVAIADVSGKGLAGCMITSMLSALLRAYKDDFDSPSALLATLDEKLSFSLGSGTFVTMFYGILDPASATLTHASAAHCPTLVYRRSGGTVETAPPTGIPLGAIRGGAIRRTLRDQTVHLEPGDMVVQYTDGVNETFDPGRQEQFGFERLRGIVADSAPRGWHAVAERLNRELTAWRGDAVRDDDETLVAVTYVTEEQGVSPAMPGTAVAALSETSGEPVSRAALEIPARLEDLSRVRPWLMDCEGLDDLEPEAFEILHSALYEACANIIEHGYGGNEIDRLLVERLALASPGDPGAEGGGRRERFLIRDQGRPFRVDNWEATNFADRDVRRKGRGFGLDIIHRAMVRVEYCPSTPQGNVTSLEFDPSKLPQERKARYA